MQATSVDETPTEPVLPAHHSAAGDLMKSRSRAPSARVLLVLLGLFGIIAPGSAHAYIDPLSGSIIFQVAVAGMLAAVVTLRRFWARVALFFRGVWQRARVR